MTQEEKAKAYDEAIKYAHYLINERCKEGTDGSFHRADLQKMFPELKISEDEKIRKGLIQYFNDFNLDTFAGLDPKKILVWLENQGEQKVEVKYVYTKFRIGDVIVEIKPNGYCQPVTVKYVGEGAYSCESDDGKRSLSFPITSQDEYKLVERKPTDKVEPKFRIEEGKWYICISQYCNCIEGRCYQALSDGRIIDDFSTEYDMHSDAYKYFRLWTIQDAKDGDVLVYENDIVIFKENSYNPEDKSGCMFVYCSCNNFYEIGGINPTYYKPATKEQRDFLFQKMKEAGYEWNADKKELKKIEHTCELDNSYACVKFPFKAKVKSTGTIVSIHGGQLSPGGKEWIKYQSDAEDGYKVYEPNNLELVCDEKIKLD